MTVNRTLNRRTFLRASGVALALPLLESMHPALARAAVKSPKRMVNICSTLGFYSASWFPKTAGAKHDCAEVNIFQFAACWTKWRLLQLSRSCSAS